FQVFDSPYILTTGGPGDASRTVVMYIYETGFRFFQMGYASVVALSLFGVVVVLTAVQFRLGRVWVFYQWLAVGWPWVVSRSGAGWRRLTVGGEARASLGVVARPGAGPPAPGRGRAHDAAVRVDVLDVVAAGPGVVLPAARVAADRLAHRELPGGPRG